MGVYVPTGGDLGCFLSIPVCLSVVGTAGWSETMFWGLWRSFGAYFVCILYILGVLGCILLFLSVFGMWEYQKSVLNAFWGVGRVSRGFWECFLGVLSVFRTF